MLAEVAVPPGESTDIESSAADLDRQPGVGAGVLANAVENENENEDAGGEDATQLDPLSLSDEDRSILDFESLTWKKTAIKERAIVQQLGVTPMKYYQRLAWLSSTPAASQYAPATVRRLNEAFAKKTAKRLV